MTGLPTSVPSLDLLWNGRQLPIILMLMLVPYGRDCVRRSRSRLSGTMTRMCSYKLNLQWMCLILGIQLPFPTLQVETYSPPPPPHPSTILLAVLVNSLGVWYRRLCQQGSWFWYHNSPMMLNAENLKP